MKFNTKVPVYRCEFVSFADCVGNTIDRMTAFIPFRVRVKMLDPHEKLGGRGGEITVTSQVRSIDFEMRVIVTQNSIYTY